jgi:hypothetical protein
MPGLAIRAPLCAPDTRRPRYDVGGDVARGRSDGTWPP